MLWMVIVLFIIHISCSN